MKEHYYDILSFCSKYNHANVLILLLKIYKQSSYVFYEEAFVTSAECGFTTITKILLDYCVDVHYESDIVLILASMNGYTKMAKLLLDNNANIHAHNIYDDNHVFDEPLLQSPP